jgi:hypothetical protein
MVMATAFGGLPAQASAQEASIQGIVLSSSTGTSPASHASVTIRGK